MLINDPRSAIRFASVFAAWSVATWCYYSFSHYVHHRHFHFERHNADNGQGGAGGHEEHRHGQHGDFDSFHLSKDRLFFYGLAVPLVLLTVAGLIWPGSDSASSATRAKVTATKQGFLAEMGKWANRKSQGDVNVTKWTLIWFLLPLLYAMYDGARGHNVLHPTQDQERRGSNLYVRVCMSLMSPSGYAATWALALFLIPVAKHSPILDWLRVTPVQALAFHRVAGWTSLWNSLLHGFLHLRHLMDVLNPRRERTPLEQLRILLVPSSPRDCLVTQNPWHAFRGYQDPYPGTDQEARQCWLALVNGTGMVSCVAFTLLAITSLPAIRRRFYTLFYVVHIPTAWIMLVNAIWHYPTCALILIPNIVYYLSFNVPMYATQATERWVRWRQSRNGEAGPGGALMEANLLRGGSIELTFAVAPGDPRHENRFVRVLCPSASSVYHPFSTFSRDDLAGDGDPSMTASILLRSKGPFTEGLKEALFSTEASPGVSIAIGDAECPFAPAHDPRVHPAPASSRHEEIQFDSYYAGSYDWVDRAISYHDEIMILAGGVGIVPFLEFLPALQRRIQAQETSRPDASHTGPDRVHLHWYCREVGLASHVWHKRLRPHLQGAWENDPACRGRLRVHLHLTSLNSESSLKEEDALENLINSGSIETRTYNAGGRRPVRDARFAQSRALRLLLPGFLVVAGTVLHWWWYERFVVDDKFRRNNLIIRSQGVVFSLVLAALVSGLVELYFLRYSAGADTGREQQRGREQESLLKSTSSGGLENLETAAPTTAKMTSYGSACNCASATSSSSSSGSSMGSKTGSDGSMDIHSASVDFLEVTRGRPPVDAVIRDILEARRPGVYSCGPRTLLDLVEGSIRRKRDDCAFYEEDSEM